MCPPSSSPDRGGDPWAEDSGDDDHAGGDRGQDLEREWRAREQQYFNTGYRDGLEDGKARTTQHGFDAGFRAGAAEGFSAGAVRGALDALRLLRQPPPPPAAASAPAATAASGSSSLEALAALFASAPKAQVAADLCSRLAAAPLRAEAVLGAGARAASGAAARSAARSAAGLGAQEGGEEAEEVEGRVAVSEGDLRAALERLDQVAAAVAAEGRGGGQSRSNGGGNESSNNNNNSNNAPEALRLPEPLPNSADTRAMMDELRAALRERLGGLDVAEPPPPL